MNCSPNEAAGAMSANAVSVSSGPSFPVLKERSRSRPGRPAQLQNASRTRGARHAEPCDCLGYIALESGAAIAGQLQRHHSTEVGQWFTSGVCAFVITASGVRWV
jgi:hypothetical protein